MTAREAANEGARQFRRGAEESDRKRNEATAFPAGVRCLPDLSYGPHGVWNRLNLYFPEKAAGALPVIVSIHGGGYVYGDKEVYHFYCADLARRGFAVVNFNYRLAPEDPFPAQLEDINALFAWLIGNAAGYAMDLDRLFLVGDSAGAQLASQYAAMLTNPAYAARFAFSLPPVRVRALGLNGGMYDLIGRVARSGGWIGACYLGEGFDLADPRLDVLGAVTGEYPPTHITTAEQDFNRDNAEPFAALLREKGVPAECRCYKGTGGRELGHVFHVDIRYPEAAACNDEQCAFFLRFVR